MLDVYVDPCTINCRKVLAGLDLLGTPFNEKFISYFKGEQKSADYLKVNPNATIPAAVDGDTTITESNAILMYASDLKPSNAYPTDIKKRAVANAWLLWESSAWFPCCYKYLVENVVKPLLGSQPDESVLEAEAPRFNLLAGVLEAQLKKTKWILGDEPSIVDISVASPMHLYAAQKLPLEKYPNITRWLGLLESLPSWQKTQGAVDSALLPKKNGA